MRRRAKPKADGGVAGRDGVRFPVFNMSAQARRAAALTAAAMMLAGCSATGKYAGNIDPQYGVSSSPRVIAEGQPVPKGGGKYRVGKPYTVAGRVYTPEHNPHYRAEGMASWYGSDFHGRLTANGEVYDKEAISAAHPTLPLPSYARVTNLANGRSIIVRVNDRGPYAKNRLIDLSSKAAELLRYKSVGLARVRVEYVGPASIEGSDDRKLLATLREGQPAPAPSVMLASNTNYVPQVSHKTAAYRSAAAPIPSERPYDLGRYAPPPAEQAAQAAVPVRTAHYQAAQEANQGAIRAPAYAPVQPVGFASGRGLY
jgi:rare lipoprotein A